MHLSLVYAFKRITHVCIYLSWMHLTESQVYAFNRNTLCMHLTESHMYAFNRITHVCIIESQVCI